MTPGDICRLLALHEATPKLQATDRLTSKMWILPNGKVMPLTCWHFEWILTNRALLKTKFGLEVPFEGKDGEGPIRLWALRNGFTRVNYEHNGGRLVIECNERYFDKNLRDVIFMLCTVNAGKIDNMTVSVLNDEGKVVKSRSMALFAYDDLEKLDRLPLISDSIGGPETVAVWKAYRRENRAHI
jgi:hypothetical protein